VVVAVTCVSGGLVHVGEPTRRTVMATSARLPRLRGMSEPDVVRLIDLRESPLEVGEVVDALEDRRAGALTIFVGRVRDHDHGRGVERLDYSAHPTAAARLEDVARRIEKDHDILGLAAVHRVGTLEIGDIAVIVATTSAHRGV